MRSRHMGTAPRRRRRCGMSGLLAARRDRPPRDAASPSRTTHNVTPEEDYRTAVLSDSPDAGCSLCGWSGIVGATQPRSWSAIRRGPGAARLRSCPSFGAWQERRQGQCTDDKRGTALGAGPRHQLARTLQVMDTLATGRPAHAGKQQTKQKHIKSRPEAARGKNLTDCNGVRNRPLPCGYAYGYSNYPRIHRRIHTHDGLRAGAADRGSNARAQNLSKNEKWKFKNLGIKKRENLTRKNVCGMKNDF